MNTIFLLLVTCFAGSLLAQGMGRPDHVSMRNRFGNPLFEHNVYNYADAQSDKSIFDFNYTLVNDLLTFIKSEDERFHANYEINLIIYDNKKNPLLERFVTDEVSVEYFEETNSRRNPKQGNIVIPLPPGDYYYLVNIIENEVPQELVPMTKIELRDFDADRLHSSDIIFVDSLNIQGSNISFYPNINAAFSNPRSAYTALIYLYPPQNAKSITINYELSNTNGYDLVKFDTTYSVSGLITIPFFINFKDLSNKPGRYMLNFSAFSDKQKVKLRKHFSIHWSNTRQQANNIDLAIEQLKLIANRKTVEKLKEAPDDEKNKLYSRFWQQRDPTPETEENELEQEFLSRVNFSNQNFVENYSGRGGWNTDRGHIYIKYGPPTRIERHQGDISSPGFEIWHYSNVNRTYYFADRDNNGTFRLVKIE